VLDNSLIIAVLVGIVVVTLLWVLLRNRGTGPALPDEKKAEIPAAPVIPPIAATEPVAAPAKPKPKPKAKAVAPAAKEASAKKPVAKKVAKSKAAPAVPAPMAAPSMTEIGVPAAVGAPDNLLLLKGVGPKLNTLLIGLGITRFDQIGGWTAEDAAKVDAHLGAFKGRIERDSWIAQAGLLARGEIAAFETRFGKLDSEN
jgi:predicted flap endonuclease-1-like 5' DNA nuclease